MLGQQISESKGKRLVRRVLSTEPPTVEVSFEDSGTLMGVKGNGFGTYTAAVRADGSIFGTGEGLVMTADGEAVTWKGSGWENSARVEASATVECCSIGRLRRSIPR